MLKKLFSHTIIYGLAPQISKLAGFLVLPLITAYLTDVDYGVYGVMTAYTAALSVFAVLGLRMVLINSFYHYPGQHIWLWRQIYGFLNLYNILYALILGTIIFFAVPKEAFGHRWTIVLLTATPFVIFGQTATIGMTYYQLRQMPMQIAWRSSLFGLLTIFLNVFFIVNLKMGYMGWFWSTAISTILSNASYWYPLNRKLKISPIYNFKWRLIKRSLKVSLPIIPHHYSSYLVDSSDRLVMDWNKIDTGNIGKYNMAYSFANVFNSLGSAVSMAINPLMNELFKKNDDYGVKKMIYSLQLVFFAITFLSSIWLKEIFMLMIKNETLKNTYPLAIILIMSYNYRPMYLGSANKLVYTEKTNTLWKLTLVAGLINLGLNLIFIPIYGYKAAVFTTFFSLMYMGYAGFFYRQFKEINKINYSPVFWLSATCLLTCAAYYMVELKWIFKIFLSICYTMVIGLILLSFRNKFISEKI